MTKWRIRHQTEGTGPSIGPDRRSVMQGEWYATPEGAGMDPEPDYAKALGPCATRPDLEAVLVRNGIGFMDLL